jgi:hypothetical protein
MIGARTARAAPSWLESPLSSQRRRVTADIIPAGIATAIPIEPCHGLEGTNFQRLAEHIAGWNWSTASVGVVVSEHEAGSDGGASGVSKFMTPSGNGEGRLHRRLPANTSAGKFVSDCSFGTRHLVQLDALMQPIYSR